MQGKVVVGFLGFLLVSLIFQTSLRAEWVNLSARLPEADIRWVGMDSASSKIIYAASARRLYKTLNGGATWKQVFALWGFSHQIQSVYLDPLKPARVYVTLSDGVWRSDNSGKSWDVFFQGIGGESKSVFCISASPDKTNQLWLGTAAGLVVLDADSGEAKKLVGFPNMAVSSILISDKILVSGSNGIYKSTDRGAHWERMLSNVSQSRDSENQTLEEMGVEEMSPLHISASSKFIYMATDRGVFRWDPSSAGYLDMSTGLDSKETRMVFYDKRSDSLFSATKKGIYQWTHPDSPDKVQIPEKKKAAKILPSAKDVWKIFENEPTIGEIQKAAIEYAEVHPRKIQEWRRAAAKSAWLPTVFLSQKLSHNQNIDIDRGGTTDPDRFINGPEENGEDWSVNMSWNLGELLWNPDQTSIDSRSKLMAELRDDVMNEVTHLYYERRRLQMEMVVSPAQDLPSQIESQLRLDELTAGIDGLTGGYLSSRTHSFIKS